MITLTWLLDEMANSTALTYYPAVPYKTKQSSSYDRRSVRPDQPGWFANADAGHYAAVEERDGTTEHVLLHTDGPGCLVRIWSANPRGIIKVYIDGGKTPVIEADFCALLEGRERVPHPLAALCSGGRNLYLPIPYARSCRVVVAGSGADVGRLYYHVNYRTYEAGTRVTSFTRRDWESLADNEHVARLARRLLYNDTAAHEGGEDDVAWHRAHYTVAPGERVSMFHIQGPRAIKELTVQLTADDAAAAMRQTLLQVGFDYTVSPQIDCPVGDFFGTGPGLAPFRSYPLEVRYDGVMTCRFVMPFKHDAVGFIWNRGRQPITVKVGVKTTPYAWTDRSMHFRARWRVDHDVVAASSRVPSWPEHEVAAYDWPYVIAHGRGVYVGSTLAIWNPTAITTLSGGWWGEGDEKVYIDGETFPSTFGTGSEDYFGYAWSRPEVFDHPFIAQPRCDGPGNRGCTVNGRWHYLDAIPFNNSLEFYMELLHHTVTPGVSYARVSYVYGLPGMRDDHVQITDAHLQLPPSVRWDVQPAPFAEGQHVVVEAEEAMWSKLGSMKRSPMYSRGEAVHFDLRRGDEVATVLHVAQGGEVTLFAGVDVGPKAGVISVSLERVVGSAESLASVRFDARRQRAAAFELELIPRPLALAPGEYYLVFSIADSDDEATPVVLGIDYIRWLVK